MTENAMNVLDTHPELLRALSEEMTPKFLASRSAEGVPNFLLRKSVRCLDADPRVGILVITTELEGWILQGDFVEWQRTGEYVERLNSTDLLRYNAYTGIRSAGVIAVRQVQRRFHLTKARVLRDYLAARLACLLGQPVDHAGQATPMPPAVRTSFQPLTALRSLAFLGGEGYPQTVPILSLQPAGESRLVCAHGPLADVLAPLPPGTPIAASLLTQDIVSFQVKGSWLGHWHLLGQPLGALDVGSVFAGGPPIPGRQVA
jgi:hypothetical protein